MGASIDDKVVAMSFESGKFETGVHKTISSLDRLKAALHFGGAAKGLEGISASANKVNLSHISQGVDAIKQNLQTLKLVAIGVFSQLATQAIRFGGSLLKSLTITPLMDGLREYETQINAVQVILGNTSAAGVGLDEINSSLDQLNTYADKTIYNFAQMTKNVGTFTAAGVDLETSVASIKGIANMAALSGSSAEQASNAMYQLSQAISSGKVSLMDWKSVENASMGSATFKRALAQTAVHMGTLKDNAVKMIGPMKNIKIEGESFRNSIMAGPGKESWLTSDVLTTTLKQLSGDMTDAQLKAKGYTKSQIKDIQQMAQTALQAATTVKTFTQLVSTTKEQIGTGWASTLEILLGDFGEAKKLFTGISEAIGKFTSASAKARNKVLGDWKALGGRTLLIDTLSLAFKSLGQIMAPIKEAFREIFPAKTGADLFHLTALFHQLVAKMKPSAETIDNLKRTFKGLFSLMDIGKKVVVGIFSMFGKLIGSVGSGEGGFLSFTATIGDFITNLNKTLEKGNAIGKFFDKLGGILAVPIELFGKLAGALGDVFSKFSSGGFFKQIGGMSSALTPFQKVVEVISRVWNSFTRNLSESGILEKAFDSMIKFITGIGPAIGNAAASINFDAVLQVIKTGLFAGIFLMLKGFFGKGSFLDQVGKGLGGGILSNIAGTFRALEGSMVALQTNIKAKTLKEIAIAIGILALSVIGLSFVDPDDLKKSLVAITFMMGQLLGAMAILEKITASGGFVKLPIVAGALILLAGAIDVLAIAVIALSFLSWEELAKGLGSVAILLGGLSAAVIPLSANSAGMVRAGIGIGVIAGALLLLTASVKILGSMDLKELGKGLGGVAAGLIFMVGALTKMPIVPLKSTVGLVAMAGALAILAGAIKLMSSMSLKEMGIGLLGFAGGLGGMVLAMRLMPKNMAKQALGLVAVAVAMRIVADALVKMGGMSWKEIARGLAALGGALAIMAGGLYLMSGTLAGAAALTVAAAGIALLAPALKTLAGLSWEEIIRSLVALGAAIGVLGLAALLLTPVIPAMIGLGAALVLIGAGLALAGAGVFLIGAGLSAIAVAGPAAVGILVAAMVELQKGVIENAKLLILGLLEIVDAFAATAPKFVAALIKIIDALVDGIIKAAPKIATAFTALINMALKVLRDNQPKLIKAGYDLLTALLQGLSNNIPKLVSLVGDIIVKFLNGISNNLTKIVLAGSDILVNLIKGIAQHIAKMADAAGDLIVKFITAIGNNLKKIIDAGVDILVKLLEGIAKNIRKLQPAATDIIIAFIQGIGKNLNSIIAAGVLVIIKFIQGIGQNALLLAVAAMKAVLDFLNGLTVAVNIYAPQIRAATATLGVAIVMGMISGITSKAGELYAKVSGVVAKAKHLATHPWEALSPSRVMVRLGENIIDGMVKGLDVNAPKAYKSAEAMSNGVIKKFTDIFQVKSPSKVMIEIGKEVSGGFAQGIRGSADDIRSAFQSMNEMLLDEMESARETIIDEQERLLEQEKEIAEKRRDLKKLRDEKKPNKESIRDAENDIKEMQVEHKKILAVIALNKSILEKTTDAHKGLTKELASEKKELISLANQYDSLTTRLEAAQDKLTSLRQEKANTISGFREQYSTLPTLDTTSDADILTARTAIADEKKKLSELLAAEEVDAGAITAAQTSVAKAQSDLAELLKGKVLDSTGNSVDQLATYIVALKNQSDAVGAYKITLEKLRALGLDDATYNKLLAEGTADQEFASQLLKGGKTAIRGLKTLDKQLQTNAGTLAVNAGNHLKNVGISAAQGVVDGLESKREKVNDKMEQIAREMVATMKRELKQKSPSKVFAEIGKFSMEGMAEGLNNSAKVVMDATKAVAKNAMTTLQKSMRDISNAVANELDTNPVITPVLDLSLVRGQSRELANLIPITAAASYGQASIISAQRNASLGDQLDGSFVGTSIKLEQNNYSPEALSAIDIYRQTRNQMAQLKSVLAGS